MHLLSFPLFWWFHMWKLVRIIWVFHFFIRVFFFILKKEKPVYFIVLLVSFLYSGDFFFLKKEKSFICLFWKICKETLWIIFHVYSVRVFSLYGCFCFAKFYYLLFILNNQVFLFQTNVFFQVRPCGVLQQLPLSHNMHQWYWLIARDYLVTQGYVEQYYAEFCSY